MISPAPSASSAASNSGTVLPGVSWPSEPPTSRDGHAEWRRASSANRSGARYALVAGERDLAEGVVQVKDLESGEQEPVALDAVAAVVRERLA